MPATAPSSAGRPPEPQFSATRTADVIDIVIGPRYRRPATGT
ncbi:hypothetical protein [Paractinoplanes abujensis]|uniref:Uncharacterized protein n=1 Tax=Paractinoplanes abujensis TaxID=882441 RepID=A0A7W7G1G3_9ACTN|nr:hypothetical protein [Actinoplanes abujensis]MBB4692677.1 hypothetical protein [Actinoplanes abujensis]